MDSFHTKTHFHSLQEACFKIKQVFVLLQQLKLVIFHWEQFWLEKVIKIRGYTLMKSFSHTTLGFFPLKQALMEIIKVIRPITLPQ